MSGIFGLVCREKVGGHVLYTGLRRLFYRGVDGSGVAFVDDSGSVVVRKKAVSIDRAREVLSIDDISTDIAIGHVWHAVRGAPVDENSQPHRGCRGEVFVVSDGLIKNYDELKRELRGKGHVFTTTTDSEVLAHILEDRLDEGLSVLEALRETGLRAIGVYTAIFMVRGARLLGFVARELPIVLGLGEKCFFISSDTPSLYGIAREALVIEEDAVGVVSDSGFQIISLETGGELRAFTRKVLKREYEYPEKGGYPHFMLKEIYEVPEALRRTILSLMEKYLRLAAMIIANARGVVIIGSGSSYHAGLLGQYYFSKLAQISSSVVYASEFPHYAVEGVTTGTVVLAVSQSGETSDVIKSVKLAKSRGAVVIGVTNTLGSRLTLHSNVYLPIGAGPELAIPATKTFTSTIAALLILATYTGLYRGVVSESSLREVYDELEQVAVSIGKSLREVESRAEKLAATIRDAPIVYVVGSGVLHPIALEGVLKLKEASLTHAVGLQMGELRHGHIAVLGGGAPVILLEPLEEDALELYEKLKTLLEERKARVIEVGRRGDLPVPESGALVAPIAYAVSLQMLAYKLGVAKNAPINTPPGLVKAVTV
ncbi:MAG: glutamine--fructose-6-phosphate transaminase (isomerizing) [Acidilobaceae archaeon]